MKKVKNQNLEQFITSLIGERPIERDYSFNGLCAYYFLEESKRDTLRQTIKKRLYFPVFCNEISPTYHTLANALEVVLEDCFGDEVSNLIMEEMDFRELIGCNEEKLVIANYSAGVEFGSKLIQSLNTLLAKIENVRKEILVADNQYHTADYGN